MINWDFSNNSPWPTADARSPIENSDVVTIDGPRRLRLVIRNGLKGELNYWFIQLSPRRNDLSQLNSLAIYTEPDPADEIYTRAIKLAETWKIDGRSSFERFKTQASQRPEHMVEDAAEFANDPVQPRSIVIRKSFAGRGKEWTAVIGFGLPHLTTQPAIP